jgi:hypothetical protein
MKYRWALPGAALLLAAGSLLVAGCEDDSKYSRYSIKPAAGWTLPRMPDGTPDLQGVWGNNSVTPMVRPWQWKDKTTLTDAEVDELKGLVASYIEQGGDSLYGNVIQIVLNARDQGKFKPLGATTGVHNEFWNADREWDNRTSLIIDPPDGQFPPLTPDAEKRRAEAAVRPRTRGPADGPEDRTLLERCISYGAPRIGPGYNSYVQIVQSPETVVLLQEIIHDARVVPMIKTPHLPKQVRQIHGDPRGHWDGDSLVVETTNYRDGFHMDGYQSASPDVTVTERYTRVGPDFIHWDITVDDPATWTRPFTFRIVLKKANAQIYEYACHEGNYSMEAILAGARRQEALTEVKK